MKKFPSIKKNEEFRTIYREGKSAAGDFLVMYVMPGKVEENRIGISASKKVGNSVKRHRCTRLVRECFRNYLTNTKEGYDIVVVVRAHAASENYEGIAQCYAELLRRLDIAK